ncbi:MAG: DUF72 domain-containing protein [Fimbriimonadaceae bacterium]|nr:DUF72 domain-containing protein [Fimbriimonadaceae bacterium]
MAEIRVGMSGYAYPEWQGEGLFYPPGLAKSKYLTFYASRYGTVEGVGMFRSMPAESTAAKIIKECPPSFHLSPKMNQSVTHFKRLKPESLPVVEEFLKPLAELEAKGMMGPTLIQLPPNFAANLDVLEAFLAGIPHRPTLRWAVEFRHPSWQTPETETLLKKHAVAWVADDTDDADAVIRETADHLYVRLRKTEYSDANLKSWAARLKSVGQDAHVYVRHTDVESPWLWADRLVELVGE